MAVHGKTGYITFKSADVCATNWAVNRSVEEVDVTTFCSANDFKEYISGFAEASRSFTTLNLGGSDLFNDTGAAEFGNDDVTLSGTILITSADSNNDVGNRFETTYNFRFTGPVTVGTP